MKNLGNLLREMGELEHAEQHLKQALAVYENHLGPEHPETIQLSSALETING